MSVEPRVRRIIAIDSSGNMKKDLSEYKGQDIEEVTTTLTYVGKLTTTGLWLILSIDTTTGVVIRYANISNNSTKTTYTLAWTDRASLTYELLEDLIIQ